MTGTLRDRPSTPHRSPSATPAWVIEKIETFGFTINRRTATRHPNADLSGLPPTLVITNKCDTLRDEAEQLAEKMSTAGVDARAIRHAGLAHGVFWMSLAVARGNDQRADAAEFLVRHLARVPVGV